MNFNMTLLKYSLKCRPCVCEAVYKTYHSTPIIFKWPSALKITKKTKQKPIKIWQQMTLWDLAKSLKKDLKYVEEVLKPELNTEIDVHSNKIKDLNPVCKLLRKEGLEYSIISAPLTSVKENVEKKFDIKTKLHCKVNEKQVKRPPIVTIMGHVDHGKTTLLDALRNTNVVAQEFGGITQHIGAFSVSLSSGDTVTFIDTPGHAAFSAMRNRGAEVTDIVVLIVAADDGVMEQTVESIKMAKNAGVPIIVAVNKIDKGPIDLTPIKQQLLAEGVQAEDMGGDVQVIPISALKKKNLDLLIEAILLQAELMALTGDPDGPVEGVVIESSIGRSGKVATVIVKNGTIRKRVILLSNNAMVRVRGMYDQNGRELSEMTLSQAGQIIGWRSLPNAGDTLIEVESEKEARAVLRNEKKTALKRKMQADYEVIQKKAVQDTAAYAERKNEEKKYKETGEIEKLKELFIRKPVDTVEEKNKLNIIIKGDVDGSVDAILDLLDTYDCDEDCELNIIKYEVGNVTETDIDLAETFNASIYCFNVNYPEELKNEIISRGIKLRFHNIIYKLFEDLKQEIDENMPDREEENVIGTAEVLQNYMINEKRKKIPVAGSVCTSGELQKDKLYRVIRGDTVLFDGELKSLKHLKNEVNTIKKDQQCGIMLLDFTGEFVEGDLIICYEKNLVHVPVSWNPGF